MFFPSIGLIVLNQLEMTLLYYFHFVNRKRYYFSTFGFVGGLELFLGFEVNRKNDIDIFAEIWQLENIASRS